MSVSTLSGSGRTLLMWVDMGFFSVGAVTGTELRGIGRSGPDQRRWAIGTNFWSSGPT